MLWTLFGETQAGLARRVAAEKAAIERRLANCESWHSRIKWKPELNIYADSYRPLELWHDVEATEPPFLPTSDQPSAGIHSPNGKYIYVVRRLERGHVLRTYYHKSDVGSVMFDGDVRIPALYESKRLFDNYPWMSITPMEILTLRVGTMRAKGSVIVAGLGLGHQLIEVSKRKQVTKLVLVERDEELVSWILPRVEPHLGRKIDEVIVGDAYKVLPKLRADVALVDIFPGLGNTDKKNKLRSICHTIDFVWCWGGSFELPKRSYGGW